MRQLAEKCARLLTAYEFAQGMGALSLCKRSSVGCVIVSPDVRNVYGVGLNGPPSGADNDRCDVDEDPCGCAHAEVNALVKVRMQARRRSLVLMVTKAPCQKCAAATIESGIVGLVIRPGGEMSVSQRKGAADLSDAGVYALDATLLLYAARDDRISQETRRRVATALSPVFENYATS